MFILNQLIYISLLIFVFAGIIDFQVKSNCTRSFFTTSFKMITQKISTASKSGRNKYLGIDECQHPISIIMGSKKQAASGIMSGQKLKMKIVGGFSDK